MKLKDIIMRKLDKLGTKGDSESTGNASKIVSEAAVNIIKRLSGTDAKRTKKVVDNVITLSSASGGAGASTVISNVAYMIGKKELKVLVIDLNIMYPAQHSYFGLKQEIEKPDLVSYLLGKNSLGDSINTLGKISILCSNNRGLMDSINCESDIAIANFQGALDKLRQLFDVVLIDAPMRIDHTLVNTAFYMSDHIYLMWDEGIASISNTERIRRNMALSGIDSYTKMKVVLNKRTNIHYSNYPFQKLNIELVQILPFDTEIIDSSLRSQIFCDKGTSTSKNAASFYEGIQNLSDKILENGGYIK